ncbi:hypothetical protein GGR51DRAFT_485706 [Nemania sp. FL0031]|nr:hypothetical protein GGR51DRAFT_485706 [Nemania sp. FL0031]
MDVNPTSSTLGDSYELGNQFDFKSSSEAMCADSGRNTPCSLCSSSWNHLPADGTSSENTPFFGMLLSHFAGAFAQLKLLGPESSLSARLDDDEKLSNDTLHKGTVFLRKSPPMAVENSSTITEIRISWEKGRSDKESMMDSFTGLAPLSYYNNLEDLVYLTRPNQRFTVYYKLTLESYTSHENSSQIVHNKIAPTIHGDLYHRSIRTEPLAHWTICSSESRSHNHVRKLCIDFPVSYNGFFGGETALYVVIGINMCPAAVIRLALQDPDHNTLKDSFDRKADQFRAETQTSVSHQGLFLRADCCGVIREGSAAKHEITPKHPRISDRVEAAMDVHESSAASGNPKITQSQSKGKSGKRRKCLEELGSEQVGRQTTPRGLPSKRIRLPDDTGGLACPFYKRDPWKFDHCLSYKLSKMSYVKQHLLRYHDAPHCNCSIYQQPVNNEAEQDCHNRTQYCQQSQYTLCVMTAEQKRDIQSATGRKITCEDKWYQIWSILFPGAKRPDSPFVKGHYFAEVISSIQAFYHGSRSHIVEETFRRERNDGHTYHEAFGKFLRKVEYEAVTHSSQPGSPFYFGDSTGAEGADRLIARNPSMKSLSTDNKEAVPFSSIRGDHGQILIPSPSVITNDTQEPLLPGHSSGILPYSNDPQEVPSIYNDARTIESYWPSLGSLGTSQFQMDPPTEYSETWSFSPESGHMSNHNDNSIDPWKFWDICEFPLAASPHAAADYVGVGTEIANWGAN